MGIPAKVIILGLFSAGLIWTAVFSHPDGRTHLYIVGGTSTGLIIRSGEGKVVLINPTSDSVFLEKLGSVLPFYERQLEAVVLTDASDASVSTANELASRYQIKTLFSPGDQNISKGNKEQHLQDDQRFEIAGLLLTITTLNQVSSVFLESGNNSIGLLGKTKYAYWQALPDQTAQLLIGPSTEEFSSHLVQLRTKFNSLELLSKQSRDIIW